MYHVTWDIDIEAAGPLTAAASAQTVLASPSLIAAVFNVTDDEGNEWVVDLWRDTVTPVTKGGP